MNILKKIFGTSSTKEVKRLMPIVNKIESLSEEYKALSDAELQARPLVLAERLATARRWTASCPRPLPPAGGRRPRAGPAPLSGAAHRRHRAHQAVSPR